MEPADSLELSTMNMLPYYHTSEKMKKVGMNSRAIERLTRVLIDAVKEPVAETLPDFIVQRLHLISRDEALRWIHYPPDAKALEKLLAQVDCEIVAEMTVLAEGDSRGRDDIIYLAELPLFDRNGQPIE